MSKGKKALLLLLAIMNIPVIYFCLTKGEVNPGLAIYAVMATEIVFGILGSCIYIVENW